jgi:K+-transporting ATPase KdpF subunit
MPDFCVVDLSQHPIEPPSIYSQGKIHCSEHLHDGRRHAGDRSHLLRAVDRLRVRLRTALRGTTMIFDYSLAALVTAGLLVYLTYALLKPEQF